MKTTISFLILGLLIACGKNEQSKKSPSATQSISNLQQSGVTFYAIDTNSIMITCQDNNVTTNQERMSQLITLRDSLSGGSSYTFGSATINNMQMMNALNNAINNLRYGSASSTVCPSYYLAQSY